MKLIKMVCPNCNANLEIDADRSQAFCSYCGTKLMMDDETININYRYVDEAKVMEAEMKKADIDMRQKRYATEDAEFQRKFFDWDKKIQLFKKIQMIGWLCFFVATLISGGETGENVSFFIRFFAGIGYLSGIIAVFSLFLWGPVLYFTNPRKKYTEVLLQREAEAEMRRARERQHELEKERLRLQGGTTKKKSIWPF